MRYYVRRVDGAIAGPYGTNELAARRAAGELGDEDEVLPARGQTLGALRRSADWTPLGELLGARPGELGGPMPAAGPAPEPAPSLELGFLRDVRARSCYRLLRGVLLSLMILGLFADGAWTLATLAASNAQGGFVALVAGAFGAVVVVATYQAGVLLVDIGDVLIHRGAHAAPLRDEGA